ncbi:MAG: DUF1553 domain-containing protein [Gemmataceae bacterium]|nr:DUF1553 domain-containing protein [Gemmataceae bacterium]
MPSQAWRSILFLCAFIVLPDLALAQSSVKELTRFGALQSLHVQTGHGKNLAILSGRDAGGQIIVTGKYANGQERDLTHQVQYDLSPKDVAVIDKTGYLSSVQEGKATLRAAVGEISTSIEITVTNIVTDVPTNFTNDIVPIFTRFGCNAGGCHGKSGGQNGFALSLLGFEPEEDYEFVVKESRGRRITVTAPEASLLLMKASGQMPHGGGAKVQSDSPQYRILKRWVEQGAPVGRANDPTVTRIEVLPSERLLPRGSAQQLQVIAHYSDGSTKDVTRLTQFESNVIDAVSVSATGLVQAHEIPGSAAIMARFLTHVDVFRATVPLGADVGQLPAAKNFIDDAVFKLWKKLGLPPSAVCDDATFLRRVTIDLAGRLPSLEETQSFAADKAADRRDKLVDRLLASPDYADLFANKWNAVLRNKRQSVKDDLKPTIAFHDWIRTSLLENKPYDQFVREILTASGEEIATPPVTWYREVNDAASQVEDVCQLFLGTRIQCARCHHHPLEKWSQQDYYGMAAFFSRLAYKKPAPLPKGQKQPKGAAKPLTHVYHNEGVAKAQNPRTKLDVKPTALSAVPLSLGADLDPRMKLAEWITSKENPYFAKALVNRYWKHFLGRGLTEPEDDLRTTNPPTNPELLDALAKYFVEEKYDLKKLVRAICVSTTYQLSAKPNEWNKDDKQNFSHFMPRRLNAEVLFDAIDQVTLAKSEFPGVPAGTHALQLPDQAFESYFLAVFGRPDATSACECERASDVNLAQMLHLMNSYEVLAKIGGTAPKNAGTKIANPKDKKAPAPKSKVSPGQRLGQIVADKRSHQEKIRDLYLIAVSREPNARELQFLVAHVQRQADVRSAYEDVLWVLVNSEEFLFNH